MNWILNPFVAAGAQVKAAAGGNPEAMSRWTATRSIVVMVTVVPS